MSKCKRGCEICREEYCVEMKDRCSDCGEEFVVGELFKVDGELLCLRCKAVRENV